MRLRATGEQLGGELGGRLEPRGQLDRGLHLLAPLVVGDAEDGDVADRGVLGEGVLDLGGVDVDATRDDHVGGPVAEVDVAVGLDPPDVADAVGARGRRTPPRSCTGSLWYSKTWSTTVLRHQRVPVSPAGSGPPSSSAANDLVGRRRPPDGAGWLSQSLAPDERHARRPRWPPSTRPAPGPHHSIMRLLDRRGDRRRAVQDGVQATTRRTRPAARRRSRRRRTNIVGTQVGVADRPSTDRGRACRPRPTGASRPSARPRRGPSARSPTGAAW